MKMALQHNLDIKISKSGLPTGFQGEILFFYTATKEL
jgi:hypothetical protein